MPDAAKRLNEDRAPLILDAPPPGWIPAATAGGMLGVSQSTIRRRISAGRLAGAMAETASGPGWYVDPACHPALRLGCGLEEVGLAGAGVELARLTARQRGRAASRMAAADAWRTFREQLPGGADVAAAFKEWSAACSAGLGFARPIGWTTMWRWITALERGEGVVDLVPRRGGGRPAEASPEAWAFFQGLWLDPGRRSIADCWRQTSAEAQRRRWAWPSCAAVRRRVDREIPRAAQVLHRRGRKALEDTCIPYIERDYDLPANAWWTVDHHQLDVAAINPLNGRPAFPWITHWQDVRSRKALGLLLHFCPCLDVVLASLRRALLLYGVPLNLLFDNGKEFRANQFTGGRKSLRYDTDPARVRAALHHLPVAVHFAQPYNAKSKPNERTFLTARIQFSSQWPTYRGAPGRQNRPEGLDKLLGDYREHGLVPKADVVEAAVVEWFDHVYGNQAHRGRGMDGRSPNQVYDAELDQVVRVADDELVLLMMRTTEPLTVGRNGVTLFGRKFHSPELFAHLGEKVYARFDPIEVGRVWVHDLDDALICVAERRDLLAWGASHDDIKARLKAKSRYRKAAAAYKETGELLTGDPIRNIALQRRAAEGAARRAGGGDGGDDGGGEPAAIRPFRTALAATAGQLKVLRPAAGAEGGAGPRGPMEDLFDTGPAAPPSIDEAASVAAEIFDSLDV